MASARYLYRSSTQKAIAGSRPSFASIRYKLLVSTRFRSVQCNFANVSTVLSTCWTCPFLLREKDIKKAVTIEQCNASCTTRRNLSACTFQNLNLSHFSWYLLNRENRFFDVSPERSGCILCTSGKRDDSRRVMERRNLHRQNLK